MSEENKIETPFISKLGFVAAGLIAGLTAALLIYGFIKIKKPF